jgi:hypothetical protein
MAIFFAILEACALVAGEAKAANVGIIAESVQNYGCGGCCANCKPPKSCVNSNGFADLCNTNANASGFYDTLETAGLGFSTNSHGPFSDEAVFDSDFVDPDIGGHTAGDDTDEFDTNNNGGVAIGFFAGHGWTGGHRGGCEAQTCQHDSQCVNPVAPEFTPPAGSCVSNPQSGVGNGICCYATQHALAVNGAVVSFNNNILYAQGYVAWGESKFSGGWANAKENGQLNLIVLNASWPVEQNYGWEELVAPIGFPPVMAGARLIAAVMPVRGDTADVPDRGSAFASYAITNPNLAVFDAWMDAINNEENGAGGDGCPGGYGFNGCGCNLSIAPGSNQTQANEHSSELWVDFQNDASDTTANGWEDWGMTCNYDLETYPFNLP